MRLHLFLGVIAPACLVACGSGDGPSSPTGNPGTGGTGSVTTTTAGTTTTTSVPAPRTLRRASFEDANGYQTAGTARIVQEGNAFSLEFLDDFRTSQSPALDVRLCNDPNCRSGAMLNFGDLQRFSGAQSYPLSDNGAQYSHVVVYCRAVRLAFGYGRLS